MNLQTQIPLGKAETPITYDSQLLLLGSCFSEHIGKKLKYFKFRANQNPFGILFHPIAIENLIKSAIQQKTYSQEDVFFLNERYHCFDAHSSLSAPSAQVIVERLNKELEVTKEQLSKATHVLITLGTAWVYRHQQTNAVVANCHKEPQNKFTKELLPINTIVKSLENIVTCLGVHNQGVQVIFTVSPVRHLKDGFVENQRSKAHLIAAIHQMNTNLEVETKRSYFPSYELMIDELRDYRFYGPDMVHPNQLAIDYIWEKFKEVWVSNDTQEILDKVDDIQKGLRHRPFNAASEQHQKFLIGLEKKIAYLQKRYAFMKFKV